MLWLTWWRDFTAARRLGARGSGRSTTPRRGRAGCIWRRWIDCFNKEVIGYAMAGHMRTDLVSGALEMAARSYQSEEDCIMHSDRGSQIYACRIFRHARRARVAAIGGRTGICWDNALTGSPFASLKNERSTTWCIRPGRKRRRIYVNGPKIRSPVNARAAHNR